MKMLRPSLSQQAFRDRIVARMTVGIGHDLGKQAFVCHAVPDPVVKPMSGKEVVILARNEITELQPSVNRRDPYALSDLPAGTRFLPPETDARKAPQRHCPPAETERPLEKITRNGRKSGLPACWL
jgi:hypothetical protein